jgi:hypothetical protein
MNRRIEQLERSVLLVLCMLAGSGTGIGLLISQLPGRVDFMMPWTRERPESS